MTRRLRHAITAEPLPIHTLSWLTRITWACPLVRGLRPALTAPRGTSASALASHPSPLGCPVLVHPLAQALSCCGGVSSSRRRHSRCKAVAEWCGLAPRHGHNHDMHLSRTENDPVPAAAREHDPEPQFVERYAAVDDDSAGLGLSLSCPSRHPDMGLAVCCTHMITFTREPSALRFHFRPVDRWGPLSDASHAPRAPWQRE